MLGKDKNNTERMCRGGTQAHTHHMPMLYSNMKTCVYVYVCMLSVCICSDVLIVILTVVVVVF